MSAIAPAGHVRQPGMGPVRRALVVACSELALSVGISSVALAQDSKPAAAAAEGQTAREDRQIVVIGSRTIIATLKDIAVEQEYESDRVASYAVSTIGEFLAQIAREDGDDDPAILVNGQPVRDIGDIADFPAEAIAKVETLPKGAAARIGGASGQRAYNIVLRNQLRNATLTVSHQRATEDGWDNTRGEALFTYIKGKDRANLTLRGAGSGFLLESERDVTPLPQFTPFSAAGNVSPFSGIEIDPALSLLAGRLVSSAALPGTPNPTLAAIAVGANTLNPGNLANFRSLRGRSRPYEAAIAGNKVLAPWLELSFNGRFNWTDNTSLSGLPAARFLVPTSNAFTPFARPVFIALNDPSRPLQNASRSQGGSLSLTLNANIKDWRVTLAGKYDERRQAYAFDQLGTIVGGFITVDNATNPFAGTLATSIPVTTRTARSTTIVREIAADAEGPLFALPAGPVRLRLGAGAAWLSLDSSVSPVPDDRSFRRTELTAKAGLTIPLMGKGSFFGSSDLTLDAAHVDLGRFGNLDRYSFAFNWQPLEWLRVVASEIHDARAVYPELLAAPTLITNNVRYFDPVTGETVEVTTVSGGAAGLSGGTQRTRRLSLTASPLRKYNLQLNADYIVSDLRNQLGGLPPPSTAVVAAFPDRFQRDASGRLVLVDQRTVNFDRQHSRELRTAMSFTIPLATPTTSVPRPGAGRRRISRPTLQFNASHTWLLASTTVIRSGLGEVDLLDGGAIGLGGGRSRHAADVGLAITDGGTGFRINANWRGRSFLQTGTLTAPDRLVFAPTSKIDMRLFADLGVLLPKSKLTKDTRITFTLENIANERQRVVNSLGVVPISYQPVYREAVGRTFMVELRKVF